MARSIISSAVGFMYGMMGIVQFAQGGMALAAGSLFRIAVGLDTPGEESHLGGEVPDIRVFNEFGKHLGMAVDPGPIGPGGFRDIKVAHFYAVDPNQQAPYVLFSGNVPSICIAYITVQWPDQNKYGWLGDWGRKCGGTWHYSYIYIEGTTRKPDCVWIGAVSIIQTF